MNAHDLALAAVVLAAGAGSRFNDRAGAKLLADHDGHPLLAHVLAAVRDFAPRISVVVLGHGADDIEAGIAWSGELRVRNHAPERGLASSIQVGIAELEQAGDDYDGAFIVLGDQPLLRPDVLGALARAAAEARPADRPLVVPRYSRDAAQARPADRPLVVPRYSRDAGPRNPVLLLRPAWALVHELSGDAGLRPLIDERPDMVLSVPVDGTMPDVDTPADLEDLRGQH